MAVVLGVHALFTLRWQAIWRLGAALAISVGLFLPWLPSLWYQIQHNGSGLGYATPGAEDAIRAYLDRVFNGDYLFGAGLALLGAVAIWRWRKKRVGLLLLLWLTVPLGLSLLVNTRFAWFIERNMIFTLSGVYILFGVSLAWVSQYRVGRPAALAAAGLFVALGIVRYPDFWPWVTPEWRTLADGMAAEARPDDVFVLRGEPYSLTYYLDRDLTAPITLLDLDAWLARPRDAERIWLVDAGGAVRFEAVDALMPDAVQTRRYVLGVLVAELYQPIPRAPLARFDGQLTLGCHALPPVLDAMPGQSLDLDLWWQALRPPSADYSVGLYLLSPDGRVVAQQDGGFDQGRVPARLLPADHWIADARVLPILPDTPPGNYMLAVAVYDWRTGERLPPTPSSREDRVFVLGEVHVHPQAMQGYPD